MSVLGPLFIPRKDMPTVPHLKDNPDAERFLQQLLDRVHTNELAVQRWANTAPRIAAVVGLSSYCPNIDSDSPTAQEILPIDGAVTAYFTGIVDSANSKIVIPVSGYYAISVLTEWDSPLTMGDQMGVLVVHLIKNGDLANPISSSGPGAVINVNSSATDPGINTNFAFQQLNHVGLFSKDDYLQFTGFNTVVLTATTPPGMPAPGGTLYRTRIQICTLQFLGATPSTVQ